MSSNYYPPDREPTLTDAQEISLALLPIVPSLLSIMGSILIIRLIVTQSKLKYSYDRMLLCMSIADILMTVVGLFQPFLVPADTSVRIWAIGTEATCTTLGFFYSLGTSSFWYSGALSIYFNCTVRKNIPDDIFASRYEKYIHAACIGWPLVWAVAGLAVGVYGEYMVGAGCSIPGKGIPSIFSWGALGAPLFIIFIMITVNNIWLYLHVRSTIRRSNNWKSSDKFRKLRDQLQRQQELEEQNETAQDHQEDDYDAESVVSNVSIHSRASAALQSVANTVANAMTIPSLTGMLPSSLLGQDRSASDARVALVAGQSFLYVASIYLVYTWPLLKGLVSLASKLSTAETVTERDIYWCLALQAVFSPSQGFWSALIYIRPRYLTRRARKPLESRWASFQVVILGRNEGATRGRPAHNISSASTAESKILRRVSAFVGEKFNSVFPSSLMTGSSHATITGSSHTGRIRFDGQSSRPLSSGVDGSSGCEEGDTRSHAPAQDAGVQLTSAVGLSKGQQELPALQEDGNVEEALEGEASDQA